MLELVAFNKPNLAPIVVIRELQQLEKVSDDGHIYVDTIMSYFESRKQSAYMVPVIVETSDFRWLRRTHLLESRESFDMRMVTGFEKEQVKEVLIRESSLYDDATFEYLWHHIGNHPGTWYMADKELKVGTKKEEVIRLLSNQFYNDLFHMIHHKEDGESSSDLLEFLRNLQTNSYQLDLHSYNAEMEYFLYKNVLLYDGDIVKPQHKMWEAMIDKYLGRVKQ